MILQKFIHSLFFIFYLAISFAYGGSSYSNEDFFDQIVVELLQDKISDNRISIEVGYASKKQINLIKKNQDKIKDIVLKKFNNNSSIFLLKILYLDGNSEDLKGNYTSYVEVPVAARYINIGEIIQPSDLGKMKVNLNKIKNSRIGSVSEIVDMQAKSYIAAGSFIKKTDVVNPPVIKINDPINIIYSSKHMNLKTDGIALGGGAIGDMVKVKNTSSGVALLGQIVNNNTVQVSGENK